MPRRPISKNERLDRREAMYDELVRQGVARKKTPAEMAKSRANWVRYIKNREKSTRMGIKKARR